MIDLTLDQYQDILWERLRSVLPQNKVLALEHVPDPIGNMQRAIEAQKIERG